MLSNDKAEKYPTHIEDLKNFIQPRLPTSNLSLDVVHSKIFNQAILLGLFVDLPLYFLNTPAIETTVGGRSQSIYHQIDSRLQLGYRVAHRLAEFVFLLSACSPLKRITDVGTVYPKVHAILIVGHLVLAMFEPWTSRSRQGVGLTLIVVRRIVTTPKTAGAGVILDASFPMFTRSIATSSERITPLRLFGCLESSVMVER